MYVCNVYYWEKCMHLMSLTTFISRIEISKVQEKFSPRCGHVIVTASEYSICFVRHVLKCTNIVEFINKCVGNLTKIKR